MNKLLTYKQTLRDILVPYQPTNLKDDQWTKAEKFYHASSHVVIWGCRNHSLTYNLISKWGRNFFPKKIEIREKKNVTINLRESEVGIFSEENWNSWEKKNVTINLREKMPWTSPKLLKNYREGGKEKRIKDSNQKQIKPFNQPYIPLKSNGAFLTFKTFKYLLLQTLKRWWTICFIQICSCFLMLTLNVTKWCFFLFFFFFVCFVLFFCFVLYCFNL